MTNKLLIILVLIIYSCKGQDKEDQKCSDYEKKYIIFSTKLATSKKNNDKKAFHLNVDSSLVNLNHLIQCFPKNEVLLREKLGLLEMNNNIEEMIPIYNKLIIADTIKNQKFGYTPNGEPIYDYRFGRFYCMLVLDSIKYRKSIQGYYEYVKQNELSIPELLKDIDANGNEIYKRMGLSYYFEGRAKTLENFRAISNKIPYKFSYDNIKLNQQTPLEFLKRIMNAREPSK